MQTRFSVLVTFFALLTATYAHAQMSLGIGKGFVTIRGVSSGASVYLCSVSREARGMYSDVVPRGTTVTDDDGNGIIAMTPVGPIVPRSIWVAVDLATGSHAAGTPADYSATEVELSAANLPSTGGAGALELAFVGDMAQFLVIRPGIGAWAATGAGDSGGAPGANLATVSVSSLESTESPLPPPTQLAVGDIVVMINSFRAEYGITRVTQ